MDISSSSYGSPGGKRSNQEQLIGGIKKGKGSVKEAKTTARNGEQLAS